MDETELSELGTDGSATSIATDVHTDSTNRPNNELHGGELHHDNAMSDNTNEASEHHNGEIHEEHSECPVEDNTDTNDPTNKQSR